MNDVGSGSSERVNLARAQAAVREFLAAIGEDPDRPGLARTPERVAEAALELFGGIGVDAITPLAGARFPVADTQQPLAAVSGAAGSAAPLAASASAVASESASARESASASPSADNATAPVSQPVVLRDLAFRSMCEHHLLPFSGRVHLAYVPGDSIVGFGRLHALLETLSARPTLQERLGDELVDAMMTALDARGALAIIEASHACAGLRGSRQQAGVVVTVSARGELSEPIARAEIISLIGAQPIVAADEAAAATPAASGQSAPPAAPIVGHVLRGARFDPRLGTQASSASADDEDDAAGAPEAAEPEAAGTAAAAPASHAPAEVTERDAQLDAATGEQWAEDSGPVNTRPFELPQRFTNLLQPAIPKRPRILGILNITPDSFSDGGKFEDLFSQNRRTKRALRRARELVAQGADIIDVGGESTRPGAVRVPQEEEAARVLPVIKELAGLGVLVSIDTMYAKTAEAALELGAEYVNDVSGGLADPAMLGLVAESGNPFILSHWRGHSVRMNELADYRDPAAEILSELAGARDRAVDAGLDPSQIVLDPGLGFAKRRDDNWAVLRELEQFVALGHPLLVGASRKRFTGEMLGPDADVTERDLPTAVITALAAKAGVWGVRVHNVEANRVALDVVDAWREGAQDD
ncbi:MULTISPECIES: dihydropteroate synthase [unclassified Pseudoclavibacter]|uniref:dihydropteroate synthase n=1 Tax=unclassified Pseudoclavibacter TaxID=2615177 RepID=UPI001BA5CF62|nr:dihydropteroate synthase [Pseudoclavibacter sp. Marseille-Q4354]MBS3180056.1 dihydropteroate synthase [Pseudoclavibacter sp. Marseille-Q4354]